jgi:hypothetical protein
MIWIIEKRKQGNEIWVRGNKEAIFIGEGYDKKQYKKSMELAKVIVGALNDYEKKNEDDFARSLFENDSGHQPC